ncbi:MAG: GlxA family transcriptional regulator [Desulfobacteraceae bacterium]|nr:GlxA family transcriptional regulator [Desulfobacteraceae bacterium]
MIRIGILALENCMQSSVTGAFDILSVASREWQRLLKQPAPLFDPVIIAHGNRPVTCFNGIELQPHMGKEECGKLAIIMIPVIFGDLGPILSDKQLIAWLRDRHQRGVCICAVCAGVFLAAETGLLSHRTATTHWNLAADFQTRYPDVILKPEKMLVDEGDFITAGGVTAYMDLSLYIAGRFGSPELALSVSKTLLIDPLRKSQTPYSTFSINTTHGDETILQIQHWMNENSAAPMAVSRLADKAGLGQRTFARRFKKATGDTPLEYLQYLRIGKARTLLETTGDSIDSITHAAGYEDVSSFRRLFKKITGLSPTAYRKKFSLY